MITLHQTDNVADVEDGRGKYKTITMESPDVVINPNYIVAIIEHDGWTSISMVNGNTFSVKESVPEIINKLPSDVNDIYQALMR